jgi:hypothetical protein
VPEAAPRSERCSRTCSKSVHAHRRTPQKSKETAALGLGPILALVHTTMHTKNSPPTHTLKALVATGSFLGLVCHFACNSEVSPSGSVVTDAGEQRDATSTDAAPYPAPDAGEDASRPADAGEDAKPSAMLDGATEAATDAGLDATLSRSLVEVRPLAPGYPCEYGGKEIVTGFDDGLGNGVAGDGILSGQEVRQASTRCQRTQPASPQKGQADPKALRLSLRLLDFSSTCPSR